MRTFCTAEGDEPAVESGEFHGLNRSVLDELGGEEAKAALDASGELGDHHPCPVGVKVFETGKRAWNWHLSWAVTFSY